MFSVYPSAYPQYHASPYYYGNNDYLARDYFYSLAQQQARERQTQQYRAQLEEARRRRRRAYQEQLREVALRARAEEAICRRKADPMFMMDTPVFDDEPFSSYMFQPSQDLRCRDSLEDLLAHRQMMAGSREDIKQRERPMTVSVKGVLYDVSLISHMQESPDVPLSPKARSSPIPVVVPEAKQQEVSLFHLLPFSEFCTNLSVVRHGHQHLHRMPARATRQRAQSSPSSAPNCLVCRP